MKLNEKTGLFIGLSLIIAALILGNFFYQAQKPQNTLKVVGIAEKSFKADTVKWNINLEIDTGPQNLKGGYITLNKKINTLMTVLTDAGINTDNINKKPVNVYKQYNFKDNNGIRERIFTGYRLQQSLYIISDRVTEIENFALNPITLLDKGIIINNSNLQYYSSQINELKKTIIAEATANAKNRAKKMLSDTGLKTGKMISIRSGVFQITEPYSTRVSGSGIYDTTTRNKQIKVTVHAEFIIK